MLRLHPTALNKPGMLHTFLQRSLLLMLAGCLSMGMGMAYGQALPFWETPVNAYDVWHYRLGTSSPASGWKDIGFDDSAWSTGNGGIGYGDGDDATIVPPVSSVYMRMRFTVPDTSVWHAALLSADYDDGFVAYLNGTEICRNNVGIPGIEPPFNVFADVPREAELYAGGLPESYYWPRADFRAALQPGENVLAIQVHNRSLTSSDLSAIFFLSLVSSDSVGLFPPPPPWFVGPPTQSNLPLLMVTTDGSGIPDEPKVDVQLQIADAGPGALNYIDGPFDAYDGQAGIELRGNSSFFFAKQSYGLEIRNASGEGLAIPLLGMPEEDDWILHGPYSDKSLIRNALAMHIAAQIDPWAPRFRFCELFIDNDYRGIYLVMERIERDGDRVDIARIDSTDLTGDAVTGGYILKIERPRLEPFDGWFSPHWPVNHFFEYHDPKNFEIQPEQRDYLRGYVTAFEDALISPAFQDPVLGYARWANRRSFAGHFLIQEITNNVDAYRLSTFLYKDRASRGGRLHMGPAWDFNLGFGNVDYCSGNLATDEWAYEADVICGTPQPFWWDRLMLDTSFHNTLRCRWDSLRAGPLATDALLDFVDSLENLLQDAAVRNFTRWPILGSYVWPNAFIGVTWEAEVDWMSAWLTQRLDWMDGAIPGFCRPRINSIGSLEHPRIRVYPSLFSEHLILEPQRGQNLTATLFSPTGLQVAETVLHAVGPTHWSLSATLPPGPYLWVVSDERGMPIGSGTVVRKP